MSYEVFLKISDSTYTQFEAIRQKLHDGVSQSQAKVLGVFCLTFPVKLLSRFFQCFYSQEMQACLQNNKLSLKKSFSKF